MRIGLKGSRGVHVVGKKTSLRYALNRSNGFIRAFCIDSNKHENGQHTAFGFKQVPKVPSVPYPTYCTIPYRTLPRPIMIYRTQPPTISFATSIQADPLS
eukprot:1372492-Amorphochlora_amoeboformis.AAC.2